MSVGYAGSLTRIWPLPLLALVVVMSRLHLIHRPYARSVRIASGIIRIGC